MLSLRWSAPLVYLDLKTTGFFPEENEIIEVGAVKVEELSLERGAEGRDKAVEFSTTVKPKKESLPAAVEESCPGLNWEVLQHSPSLEEVSRELEDFLRDHPVVCHRADTARAFLQAYLPRPLTQPFLDSRELFCLFKPQFPHQHLDYLVRHYLKRAEGIHSRALQDANDTREAVETLFRELLEEEGELLHKTRELMSGTGWPWWELLQQLPLALVKSRGKRRNAVKSRAKPHRPYRLSHLEELLEDPQPWQPHFPGYFPQEQQMKVAREVSWAFQEDNALLVEAPTGSGKTLAYLLVSLLWILETGEKVFISTNTKNLQEQIKEELPRLRGVLGVEDLPTADLKGMNNYVCLRRLEEEVNRADADVVRGTKGASRDPNEGDSEVSRPSFTPHSSGNKVPPGIFEDADNTVGDEISSPSSLSHPLASDSSSDPEYSPLLLRLFLHNWSQRVSSGEVEDVSSWLREKYPGLDYLLYRIRCRREECLRQECPYFRNCFYQSKVAEMQTAQLVVINHSLLLTWPPSYPEINRLVIDEAHQLEEKTFDAFTEKVDSEEIKGMLNRLHRGREQGYLHYLWHHYRRINPGAHFRPAWEAVESLREKIAAVTARLNQLPLQENENSKGDQRAFRVEVREEWEEVREEACNCADELEKLGYFIRGTLEEINQEEEHSRESSLNYAGFAFINYSLGWSRVLREVFQPRAGKYCCYLEFISPRWTFCLAPLEVAELFYCRILSNLRTAVLTSATLAEGGSYRRLQETLGFQFIGGKRAEKEEKEGKAGKDGKEGEERAGKEDQFSGGMDLDPDPEPETGTGIRGKREGGEEDQGTSRQGGEREDYPSVTPGTVASRSGDDAWSDWSEWSAEVPQETSEDYILEVREVPPLEPVYDYGENCVLALAADSPGYRSSQFTAYCAQGIEEIARLLAGRTLVLFTNLQRMKSAYRDLRVPLGKEGITLLSSHLHSRHFMVDYLRENSNTVLLGSRSFFEGIDIRGSSLSCILIDKLPFPFPGDPFFRARSEHLASLGRDPYRELSFAAMVRSFRQQFGRLLRSPYDCGFVVVMSQLHSSAPYFSAIMRELPPVEILEAPREEIYTTMASSFEAWSAWSAE